MTLIAKDPAAALRNPLIAKRVECSAQTEAIAVADAHTSNAALPTYSELANMNKELVDAIEYLMANNDIRKGVLVATSAVHEAVNLLSRIPT